jgi:hypothetical protein
MTTNVYCLSVSKGQENEDLDLFIGLVPLINLQSSEVWLGLEDHFQSHSLIVLAFQCVILVRSLSFSLCGPPLRLGMS